MIKRNPPAAAAAAVIAVALAAHAARAAGNPLANPDQIALETQAARLLASAPVQAQVPFVTRPFAAHPFASTAEGQATLPGAVKEVVFAAVVDAIDRDPARPRIEWLWSPAHDWFGLSTPTSKVLMPNVDNVFRIVPVDGVSHYRLVATPTGPKPTQVSLQLLPALPAEDQWNKVIQELVDSDIRQETDGSYVITIGPEPAAADRPNHIATTPASRFILIRDTIQDWATESPYRLEITRLDGPPGAATPDDDALAGQAADLARQIAPRVLAARGDNVGAVTGFFQGPANQLSSPKIREGGRWGLSSSGHFQLGDDEALVITLNPIGARYLAVQLANGWLGSLDYLHHTASLNLAQTRANPDGTVTLVVAARDPGVANWLDTTGLHEGSMFVRWQQLPDTLDPQARGVRDVRLVKLSQLDPSLPRVTPDERRDLVQARAAAYARRFAQ